MQMIGNMSAIQYVQSFEIDSRNWMWILDVGRINIFSSNSNETINNFAKLIIWDINTNCKIREFVFPDEVAGTQTNFLNDIVIDETNGYAYITDTGKGGDRKSVV